MTYLLPADPSFFHQLDANYRPLALNWEPLCGEVSENAAAVFIMTALDAGVPLWDVEIATRHADLRKPSWTVCPHRVRISDGGGLQHDDDVEVNGRTSASPLAKAPQTITTSGRAFWRSQQSEPFSGQETQVGRGTH